MRKAISIAAALVACGLVALSTLRLITALEAGGPVVELGPAQDEADIAAIALAASDDIAGRDATHVWWPAFGEPAPPPTPVRAPVTATPRFDYRLAGTMASGGKRWAILTGPGGEVIVREGDTLDGAARIDEISDGGIIVSLAGVTRDLAFDGLGALRVATVPVPADPAATAPERGNLDSKLAERQSDRTTRPRMQEVIFKDMSRKELLAVLNRAEEGRRLRKLGAAKTR